ncbi:MAG: trigger factor [Patescibacteria group bacterium]
MTKTKNDKANEKDNQSLIAPNSKVNITIEANLAEKTYQKILNRLSKQVKIPGFRKGIVPGSLAEQAIGPAKILEESLRQLLPSAYTEAINKEKKSPLSSPEFHPISLEKGKDWVIEAQFAEKPEFKLGNYKKTSQEARKEAEKEIKKILAEAEKAEQEKLKTAKKAKGEKPQGADHHDHSHKPSEEQLKEIRLQHIFRALATTIKPTIPELLIREEVQREFQNLQDSLKRFNLELDSYLENRKITQEQLANELAAQALGRLQLDFILGAIALEAKVEATDEEINQHISKIADEKLRESMKKDQHYRSHIRAMVIRDKVVTHLLD